MMLRARWVLLVCLLQVPFVSRAETTPGTATVSFLQGAASLLPGGTGKSKALRKGQIVRQNDLILTSGQGRVELTLPDQSIIRVGPASRVQLSELYFTTSEPARFRFKLLFGKLWSKVSGLVGNQAKFEVETDNAVAGVRGTTFRVDASRDRSVLLRVYAGAVAMQSPAAIVPEHRSGAREKVSGPRVVSREAWEKLVGAQMQLRVSAKGVPEEPQAFTAAQDDSWANWNLTRDAR